MTDTVPNDNTSNPMDMGQETNDGPLSLNDVPPESAAAANVQTEMDPLEAQKERYLRLAAEYDNYRKRTSKEVQQAAVRGQAELMRSMLESLDDLDRFAHLDPEKTDTATVVKGAEMVERNLMKALTNAGVEVIDPVEMPFDPNLHEAVSTIGANSPEEDHIVSQVYQRGYMLKGQLLRPARVVVKQYQ